jgi:uncharacterized protein
MQGYQVTFFTIQDRMHKHLPLCEWLMQLAKELGGGATMIAANEGFGRDHKMHSVGFIDLADQPVEIKMVLNQAQTEQLFQRLQTENINVFYTKLGIEFGMSADRLS